MLRKFKKVEGGTLSSIENFSKNNSHKAKKGVSIIVSKTVERGTLLLWNGFLIHVKGFGCVQNEVLSTYGKSA